MSTKKLQTEIDRTLKKVTEGLEVFLETLDKLNNATTPNQKEKFEGDLKKEIKKLQRLRDTIKGWQTSSEIKDKQPINDARKAIEAQMEKFKVLEKEMKIKAFSKEGLNQTAKIDPKAREKMELSNWINSTVDRLSTQVDAYEAEVETMSLNLKKGKRLDATKQTRHDLLVRMAEKHKNHIQKLESILRLMENDQVSTEQVSGLKDELEYYVESNLDEDFVENEELYDDFDFSNTPDSDTDSDGSESDREEAAASRKRSVDAQSAAGKAEKPTAPTVIPVMSPKTSAPVVVMQSRSVPAAPATGMFGQRDIDSYVKVVSPPPVSQPPPVAKISGPSFASALAAATGGQTPSAQPATQSREPLPKATAKEASTRLFDELETFLAKKFPSELLKRHAAQHLDASYQNLPENYELERNRQYCPKQPYAMPSYYQSEPPQILNNPSIFERFDLDTLFFIFYYQQKTYPQYLAARELKKQSWRFHKKYLTWFQRHEEPKLITNDYEQGTYIYFDYEGSWCQRKKTEFTFEYRYLEDEELV